MNKITEYFVERAYALTLKDLKNNPQNFRPDNVPDSNFLELIGKLINWALGFVGLIAFVYLLYGGYLYLTAGDSSDDAKKGIKVITNAVIGIVIIMMSYSLVTYLGGGDTASPIFK